MSEDDDFSNLVVNRTDPPTPTMLALPRRAIVRTQVYGGATLTLELDVIATTPGFVCVTQERPGRAPWNAWIPSSQAKPV